MTPDELAAIIDGIAPVIRDYVARAVAQTNGDLGLLRERFAVLETKAVDVAHANDLGLLRAELATRLDLLALDRIPGPAGPPGPPGADGLAGKDGAAGLRYLGVYVDGKAYELGDVVTWAGSAWHCHDTTAAKPGNGGAWQLIVKAGRDGRDKRVEAAR